MITWLSIDELVVNGTSFKVLNPGKAPTHDVLTIMKEPFHIESYAELVEQLGPDSNIVELGIRTGASTAFMAVLFRPKVLSAFEIAKHGTPAFEEFLDTHPDAARIRPHFECDQGDAARLAELLDQDFDGPLDLVVDDASHLLEPSTTSFNVLFPRLRPGGIYVIEDWSWEHYSENMMGPDFRAKETTGFARLVLQSIIASGFDPGCIAKVVVQRGVTVIYRGESELQPQGFSIDNIVGARGRLLLEGRV